MDKATIEDKRELVHPAQCNLFIITHLTVTDGERDIFF